MYVRQRTQHTGPNRSIGLIRSSDQRSGIRNQKRIPKTGCSSQNPGNQARLKARPSGFLTSEFRLPNSPSASPAWWPPAGEDPPDPIPNSDVKAPSTQDTASQDAGNSAAARPAKRKPKTGNQKPENKHPTTPKSLLNNPRIPPSRTPGYERAAVTPSAERASGERASGERASGERASGGRSNQIAKTTRPAPPRERVRGIECHAEVRLTCARLTLEIAPPRFERTRPPHEPYRRHRL